MNKTQVPVEMKAALCEQMFAGESTVEAAAAAIGRSVRTINRWLERYESGGVEALTTTRRRGGSRKKKELSPAERAAVDQVLSEHPHLRSRSLRDYLRRHRQMKVARRPLDRYLRRRGFVEPGPRREEESPPRRFEAGAPLEMVQADVMYVPKGGGGHLFAVNFLDDHSRFLLGSVALERQTGEAVLTALQKVVERWGTPKSVLTDRGTQFVHWRGRTRFQNYVEKELKAKHILAATQHPQTIGKVERFHATLRKEKLRTRTEGYPTTQLLQTDLDSYSDYYNYQRPHQGIGGLLPADRFYGMREATESALEQACSATTGVFLTANLKGRRLVLAGPDANSVRVIWDEAQPELRSPGGRDIW